MAVADVLPILLAAVLAWAGCLNVAAPEFIRAEFKAWGFSDRFRQMVGVLEWIAAAALLLQPLRPVGCAIAIAIVLGVSSPCFGSVSSCAWSIRWCCWRCYGLSRWRFEPRRVAGS